jgi:hypothetical protein
VPKHAPVVTSQHTFVAGQGVQVSVSKDHGGKPEIKFHPLAPRDPVHGSGANSTIRLIGYVGQAATGGHIRVYTDLSFSSYYEFDEEAVTQSSAVDAEDPNSPTTVWVDGSATVDFVQTSRLSGSAAYVAGAIWQQLPPLMPQDPQGTGLVRTPDLPCLPPPPPPPPGSTWTCPHSEAGMPGCHPSPFTPCVA